MNATIIRQARIAPITEAQIREMTGWQYEPPYDVYNLVVSDDPDAIAEQVEYLLGVEVRCHAILGISDDLLGFCTFGLDAQVPGGDYREEALDIGLGVRPDLTGQGLGSHFVQAVLTFARSTYRPPLFRVTIADLNERARRVWEGQDFHPVQSFVATAWTKSPFTILVRDPI